MISTKTTQFLIGSFNRSVDMTMNEDAPFQYHFPKEKDQKKKSEKSITDQKGLFKVNEWLYKCT